MAKKTVALIRPLTSSFLTKQDASSRRERSRQSFHVRLIQLSSQFIMTWPSHSFTCAKSAWASSLIWSALQPSLYAPGPTLTWLKCPSVNRTRCLVLEPSTATSTRASGHPVRCPWLNMVWSNARGRKRGRLARWLVNRATDHWSPSRSFVWIRNGRGSIKPVSLSVVESREFPMENPVREFSRNNFPGRQYVQRTLRIHCILCMHCMPTYKVVIVSLKFSHSSYFSFSEMHASIFLCKSQDFITALGWADS